MIDLWFVCVCVALSEKESNTENEIDMFIYKDGFIRNSILQEEKKTKNNPPPKKNKHSHSLTIHCFFEIIFLFWSCYPYRKRI